MATVLGSDAATVAAALMAAGFTVTDGASLSDIAAASGKTDADIAATLVQIGK